MRNNLFICCSNLSYGAKQLVVCCSNILYGIDLQGVNRGKIKKPSEYDAERRK